MGRKKKLDFDIDQRDFVEAVNKKYQKYMKTAMIAISKKVVEMVKKEAEQVYIAKTYRERNHLPDLPRLQENNEALANGVQLDTLLSPDGLNVQTGVNKKNFMNFTVKNKAKPSKSLFSSSYTPKVGDLSKWTIGDSEYHSQGRATVREKSHIHPIDGGFNLDADHWYDGDPYMERAITINKKEIAKMIQESHSSCLHAAINKVIEEYKGKSQKK